MEDWALTMKIKDLPKVDRPREKLIAKGAENLKDAELLAILLRTGRAGKNVIEIAAQILSKHSKKRLLQMTYQDLVKIGGIDSAKATTLLAAFELSKRALEVNDTNLPAILTPQDVVAQLTELRLNKKEHFIVLYLNARNQLMHKETISVGTLNANLVHPREVFEPALKHSAAGIMVAHNHPSGDPKPSEDDIKLTKRLTEAGEMMGVQIMDHIIVAKNSHLSFREEGLM
jgi:DNA repair protein RadC